MVKQGVEHLGVIQHYFLQAATRQWSKVFIAMNLVIPDMPQPTAGAPCLNLRPPRAPKKKKHAHAFLSRLPASKVSQQIPIKLYLEGRSISQLSHSQLARAGSSRCIARQPEMQG
eukprot:scaffold201251_cov17-Tisochrysis_lutea.AAC.1